MFTTAVVLTCVNESAWCPFAELLGFVGQCDFHNTRDVPRRRLHTDGMRSNQLEETVGGGRVSLLYVKDSSCRFPISFP